MADSDTRRWYNLLYRWPGDLEDSSMGPFDTAQQAAAEAKEHFGPAIAKVRIEEVTARTLDGKTYFQHAEVVAERASDA